jgi:polyisoprenoid-binding protein YceI
MRVQRHSISDLYLSVRRAGKLVVAWFLAAAAPTAFAADWQLDPAQSRLSFSATQQKAEFEGVFKEFTADIRFDPDNLDDFRIDAVIQLGSVDTQYRDRDQYIVEPEWFHVAKWPEAAYRAEKVRAADDGWVAEGTLTLKGVTLPVELAFQFAEDESGYAATFTGTAALNRLDFQVGTKDWADTSWVGNRVGVSVDLTLRNKN